MTATFTLAGLLPAEVVFEETDPRELDDPNRELFAEERAALVKCVEKRAREYAAGRILTRCALARLGLPPTPILNGADRAPIWPAGVVGSITHTRGYCAAALARSDNIRSLGIDVEQDQGLESRLWSRILTPPEMEWLATQPPPSRGALGMLFFSAKESAYKAQYPLTSMFLGFHAMSVDLDLDLGAWRATFREPAGEFAIGDHIGGRWRRGNGFIATAAVIPCPSTAHPNSGRLK